MAAPGPHPIRGLPSDLLALILRHLPRSDQLNRASLVCKEWRRAALRSVTSLSALYAGEWRAAALFPSLRELVLSFSDKDIASLPLPPQLTSLTFRASVLQPPHNLFPEPLPHLRAFSIFGPRPASRPIALFAPLLAASRATLTSLTLALEPFPEDFTAELNASHFPALTNLKIRAKLPSPSLAPFLAAHAPHLRYIDVGATLFAELCSLRYPHLIGATLRTLVGETALASEHLQTFITNAPHMTSLSLAIDVDLLTPALLSVVAAVVTSVSLTCNSIKRFTSELLTRLPRLRRIENASLDLCRPQDFCAHRPYMHSVTWGSWIADWYVWLSQTNLHAFRFDVLPLGMLPPAGLSVTLPSVRKLLFYASMDLTHLLALLAAFKRLCPNVRRISVRIVCSPVYKGAELDRKTRREVAALWPGPELRLRDSSVYHPW